MSNPFAFYRSWKVPKSSVSNFQARNFESDQNLERLVEDRFSRLEKHFSSLLATLGASKKGKGKGKKSKKTSEEVESEPCTSAEAQRRLRSYIDGSVASDIPSSLFTEDLPTDLEKTIYIKRIDCQLNSNSLDQVEDKSNADECMQMYWRMFKFNGQVK